MIILSNMTFGGLSHYCEVDRGFKLQLGMQWILSSGKNPKSTDRMFQEPGAAVPAPRCHRLDAEVQQRLQAPAVFLNSKVQAPRSSTFSSVEDV